MYDKVKNGSAQKRDRAVFISLLIGVLFIAAVIVPVLIGSGGYYRYHSFVGDFADALVYARRNGDITLSANGEKTNVSADNVSRMFELLTDQGLGQPISDIPDAENVVLYFPDGAQLTLFCTPDDNGLEYPTGVTVRFKKADGKTFMYLHRYMEYENITQPLYRN